MMCSSTILLFLCHRERSKPNICKWGYGHTVQLLYQSRKVCRPQRSATFCICQSQFRIEDVILWFSLFLNIIYKVLAIISFTLIRSNFLVWIAFVFNVHIRAFYSVLCGIGYAHIWGAYGCI